MKKTKRKGFNFFRSYYDVYNMLESDKDKLAFIEALLDKQFLGVNPNGLEGMSKFAWVSQINSIDSQVKGWEDKTGLKLNPTEGGCERGKNNPTEQLQVEGEVKEEVKEKVKEESNSVSENPHTIFLSWFNNRRETYLEKQSNINRLSYQDKKNLDELKKAYSKEDFEKVMINLCNNKYANENKRIVPTHFLEYFENYVGEEQKPLLSKKQKTNRGWAIC